LSEDLVLSGIVSLYGLKGIFTNIFWLIMANMPESAEIMGAGNFASELPYYRGVQR
jgi:hypothetical protein